MNFGQAVEALQQGSKVSRSGWNGKGMYLKHFSPVAHGMEMLSVDGLDKSYPLLPFILMKTADNMLVPWLASQTDVLADDWGVME